VYGYENWSLTLREERRLRVFENKVLRRIFGLKRDEVIEVWRKLCNRELNAKYFSSNIFWVIKIQKEEMYGVCSTYGGEQRCLQGFGGKT
jgi:hypothetical protein